MQYLIYGPDSYRAREFITDSIGGKRRIFDRPESFAQGLISLRQSGLFGNAGVTVFKNLLDDLLPDLDKLLGSVKSVVIWQEADVPSKKIKIIKDTLPQISIHRFNELNRAQTLEWIHQTAQDWSINFTNGAVTELYEMHGANLWMLANELRKIKHYLGGVDKKVGVEMINELGHSSVEKKIFSLLDALGEKKLTRLRNDLREANPNQIDEWYIYYMVIRQVRQLYLSMIGGDVKGPSFVLNKLKQQEKRWSERELKESMAELLEIEFEVKSGTTKLYPELVNWLLTKASSIET